MKKQPRALGIGMGFVFTCGDVNGVGPEISVKTFNRIWPKQHGKLYFVCPANIFIEEINYNRIRFEFEIVKNFEEANPDPNVLSVIDIGRTKREIGVPTEESGHKAVQAVKVAYQSIVDGHSHAMITSPISKLAISLGGYEFPGHTEMLAEWTQTENYVMMFLARVIKAGLMTIHIPIKKVPTTLTKKLIKGKFKVILNSLQEDFGNPTPKIAVLGLNPHAGEDGVIGTDEKDLIEPIMKEMQPNFFGPFSADAFFARRMHEDFNFVVGMYHDQVLIPFKLLDNYTGVNFTAGLPIIRTSPDHGTAFDIARKHKADDRSMYQAYIYAIKIAENRKRASSTPLSE